MDTERYRYPAAEILGDYDMLLRDKVVPFVQVVPHRLRYAAIRVVCDVRP